MINPLLYDDTIAQYLKIPKVVKNTLAACGLKMTNLWRLATNRFRAGQPTLDTEMNTVNSDHIRTASSNDETKDDITANIVKDSVANKVSSWK